MDRPPPEPMSVSVALEPDGDDLRLRVSTEAGAIAFLLRKRPPHAKPNPWRQEPAAEGEVDLQGSHRPGALIDEIALWLGADPEEASLAVEEVVTCGHDGLDTGPDAYSIRWTAVHLVFGALETYAGLHLQFVPKTGEGLLLESHVGSPELLVRHLRAAFQVPATTSAESP